MSCVSKSALENIVVRDKALIHVNKRRFVFLVSLSVSLINSFQTFLLLCFSVTLYGSGCKDGYQLSMDGLKCLKLMNSLATYDDAKTACVKDGATLAAISGE